MLKLHLSWALHACQACMSNHATAPAKFPGKRGGMALLQGPQEKEWLIHEAARQMGKTRLQLTAKGRRTEHRAHRKPQQRKMQS